MATLSFLMGFACLAPFRKKGGCQIHSAVTYMMAGLLVLNVYAEYFSLFAGVGFWASLIAVFAAVIGGMLLRRDLADFFKISKTQACQKKTERSDEGLENSKSLWRKKNKAVWLLYAGLTLLFAYGSSRGTTIRDCIMHRQFDGSKSTALCRGLRICTAGSVTTALPLHSVPSLARRG